MMYFIIQHITKKSYETNIIKSHTNLIFQQQVPPETLIKTVGQFVKDLPSSDVDAACIEIFGDSNDLRAAKLKQAVQYYLNGTKDGFLKYRTASGKLKLQIQLFHNTFYLN